MELRRTALAPILAVLLGAAGVRAQGRFETDDPGSIAVHLVSPGVAPELASLAERTGVALAGSRPFGPPGYHLLELASPLGDAERAQAVQRVAEEPEVDYATLVYVSSLGLPEFPARDVLLRFAPDVSAAEQREQLDGLAGLSVLEERFGALDGAWKLRSLAPTGAGVRAEALALAALPGMRWAEADRVAGAVLSQAQVIPNDPLFGQCWGLHNTGQTVAATPGVPDVDMDAPEAWSLTAGSPSVIVLVMDVGVQLDHPDLAVVAAADFTGSGTGGGPTSPCSSHGTAVAGCAAAAMNNGLGGAGVAPACSIAAASVAADAPDCSFAVVASSWFVDALTWGESLGARVATMSVGNGGFDQILADKFDEVTANGMVVFGAAGNCPPVCAIPFPPSHPTVHAVGGIGPDGASDGATGADLFCVAPSVDVQTTTLGGGYAVSGGTSLASPYAAGVAALVLSRQPSFTSAAVELALAASCRDLGPPGHDSTWGYGMVNAHHALVLADQLQAGHVQVDGTLAQSQPGQALYATFTEGAVAVPPGGLVLIRGGSYAEALVVGKPMLLRGWDGRAVVGE